MTKKTPRPCSGGEPRVLGDGLHGVEPKSDGNLVLVTDDEGYQLVVSIDLCILPDAKRHMPHWATCPSACEFRS